MIINSMTSELMTQPIGLNNPFLKSDKSTGSSDPYAIGLIRVNVKRGRVIHFNLGAVLPYLLMPVYPCVSKF